MSKILLLLILLISMGKCSKDTDPDEVKIEMSEYTGEVQIQSSEYTRPEGEAKIQMPKSKKQTKSIFESLKLCQRKKTKLCLKLFYSEQNKNVFLHVLWPFFNDQEMQKS
jgi:hypothetical protein